jgi:flagellar basal body rod protein FlgG
MIKGIYYTARSLDAKTKDIDVIANNIANINTVGFKRQVPFIEVLNSSGTSAIKQVTDHTQGEVVLTSNPLNVAISGDGYFTLQTEQGEQLTRNGKFKLDSDGYLVNDQGNKVLGKNGEINISQNIVNDNEKLTISKNGLISMGEHEIDTLLIQKKNNAEEMDRAPGLNFQPGDESTPADESEYTLSQGYLEESNVNPIVEMETMIQKNKDYESAYKIMNFLDKSLQNANEIGKT